MKEAIETRELIVLDGLDVVARGTYHKTCDDCSGVSSKPTERGHVGILFLNSPSPTRAAQGDSAVYWADSFAERGYPSFRLDLPGFGDSEGDFLTETDDVTGQGGYAPITSAKIRELVKRFNLDGVVIVEQCSSSISTLYAAACCPECKGLVLMDPRFDIPQPTESIIPQHPNYRASQVCRRLSRDIYDSPIQSQTFLETVSSEKGLPILIFKSVSQKRKVGEVSYFNYDVDLEGHQNQVVINMPDGTDSSFTSRLDRAIIRQRTEQWLNACFPLARATRYHRRSLRPLCSYVFI